MKENADNPNPDLTTWNPEPDDVARLAHRYFEERGYSHGSHEDDWHRAEAELRRRGRPSELSESPKGRTVIAAFNSMSDARRAFEDLQQEAFSRDEISLIASQSDELAGAAKQSGDAASLHASEVGTDAGIGAAVGGVGGLLLGLAALAIPGVGPVLAAGPIVAALGGAGLGAAAGGLVGALSEKGVPEDRAAHYAEGVRRGGILITVQAAGERADRAAEILDRNGAIDIDDRVNNWQERGWNGFEQDAQPLTADEILSEREYNRVSQQQAEQWRRASRIY